ncbi:Polysaccharide biosynthesis/export protein [Phycisphaerae bacterium RAS1]|nr:Polysaccharide biosynthesis/export protein [Phycisphaerae bacterium RAS1]
MTRDARLPNVDDGRPHLRVGLFCAVLALLCGCADKRISLDDLAALESSEQGKVEPVQIETQKLPLAEQKRFTVGPMDVLNITLIGAAETDRYAPTQIRARVAHDGSIVLPMVGRIKVDGLDMAQLEARIIEAHASLIKDLTVYVELIGADNTTVLVVGAGEQQGLVELPRNRRNVVYAVAQAGGFGLAASGRVTIHPVNAERPTLSFNLGEVNDVRRAFLAPALESGDMVVVEQQQESAIFVSGLTNRPGPVGISRDGALTLTQTVAAAGGLRDFLSFVPQATLVRTLDSGEKVRVKVDLASVYAGEAPDVALRAGDVLQIPHTLETRFQEWVYGNVLSATSVSVRYDPLQQYNTNRLLARQRQNRSNGLLNSVLINGAELFVPQPVNPNP